MSKKEKKESKLKKKIKEMKKTAKGKAILKLIRWAIFFLILFVLCIIGSFIGDFKTTTQVKPNEIEELKEEEKTPEETLSTTTLELLKESLTNYTYCYEITINNEIYKYTGTKKNNIETGYKESSRGIIKYYIDETGVYQETTTTKEPINNLYENLDSTYFDLANLFTLFRNIEWKLNKEQNSPNYLYEGSDSINHYELEHDGNKLVFIKIYNENYNYYFTYEHNGGTS